MTEKQHFEEEPQSEDLETAEQEKGFWEKVPDADVAVVHGQWFEMNDKGEPVPSLESKMRAIAALELFQQGKIKKIIFSGSGHRQGYPTDVTIAGLMKAYLVERGVPEAAILVETESDNTTENLENSLEMIERENLRKVLFETNEYHIPRTRQLLNNILEKHGLHLDETSFVSAEEVLKERSGHYDKLVAHYEFPDSLKNAPAAALKKGIREFLRRALIYIDRDDKIATFLAGKLRS